MSNPYQRKALTLATSFVIAGAGFSSTVAVSADRAAANPIRANLVNNNLRLAPNLLKGLKCDPRVCNPAALGRLNLIKRIRIKPGLVNPAPVFRFKK